MMIRKTVETISKTGKTDLSAFWDLNKRLSGKKTEVRSSITNQEGKRIEDEEKFKDVFKEYYKELLTTQK